MFGLEFDLACCITGQEKIDIGLLIKIQKLPHGVRENIEDFMIFDNLDIFDNVGIAIDTLKKYGYVVENEYEILDCIQNSNFGDIKIVPSLDSGALYAFMAEGDKTKTLLSTCINQFLENDNPTFFNDNENFNTCLMLLDDSNQVLLDMSDGMTKRICSIMQEKLITSSEINSEHREILEKAIKRKLKRLENRQSLSKLSNYFKGVEDDEQIPIPIIHYFLEQELSEKQVLDIITFFECDRPLTEDFDPAILEYNLENISNVLEMFRNADISIESSSYDMGQELMIYKLMRGAREVSINDENIESLREIYSKLRTIRGLDEYDIANNLFESDEIKNRICNNRGLIGNAVSATLTTTRTSQINNQVLQIIEQQKERDMSLDEL